MLCFRYCGFSICCVFFFQAEDGIRDVAVTGVQTCALPICTKSEARRPLMGSSLMEVWFRLLEKSCCDVLMTGASEVTSTVPPERGPIERATLSVVSRPTSTTTLSWL